MKGSWQVVPDENDDVDPRTSWSVDLRRVCGGVAVALLVVGALTPAMLDRSIRVLPAYVALSACGRSFAGAPDPSPRGISIPTGSMNVARVGHTATLLPSGKVLVAGGESALVRPYETASAELYDPTTGTWSLTGPMKSARAFHAAVLLRSGMVLVVGGITADTRGLASAELYDPAKGQWTETGDMPAGGFTDFGDAVVLRSGKVFVSLSGAELNSKPELYDPVSGSWSAVGGSMVDPRAHPGSGSTTVLGSGKVLVLDGGARAQLFDPVIGAWKPAGNMITIREWQTATLLPSGKVLVAGGYASSMSDPMSAAEIYDPATDVWSPTSSMPAPTLGARATLLPFGDVIVVGGGGPGPDPNPSAPRASVDLYDPATDSWTALRAMASPRSFFTATLLHSGALLFVGGAGMSFAANGPYSSAEIYALTCRSR
jgi:galactose oxidase-like protein/Kelch motif protein